jgi:hypothetical protein
MRIKSITLAFTALILSIGILVSCGDDPVNLENQSEQSAEEDTIAGRRVLGVCFMHGERCALTYEDRGPYMQSDPFDEPVVGHRAKAGATQAGVPVYIFPARGGNSDGIYNPLDPAGLYRPYRLQNNVFAADGLVWEMFEVVSGSVLLTAEPVEGVTIYGKGTRPEDVETAWRVRDLTSAPFMSEEEIFEAEEQGFVRIIRTFMFTDCPMVHARGDDIVINLNPNVPICRD